MCNELRMLPDAVNVSIFEINIEGDVKDWNEKMTELTGFSKSEALGKPFVSTFIISSVRKTAQEIFDEALQGNDTSNHVLDFQVKSTETLHLIVSTRTRRDAESSVIGVVVVAQDATELIKRERDATAMAKELRLLLDKATEDRAFVAMANEFSQLAVKANAPIFGIDIHGNVNEWNNKTAEITGFTREEAFGNPLVAKFIIPSLRHMVQKVMYGALHGYETKIYELDFETKSKEICHLSANATTRRDSQNEIVGVVSVAQCVTDKNTHDEVIAKMTKELHQQLHQLVDSINSPIFGVDIYGNVNEWNNKIAEFTGYSKEEAFFRPLISAFIAPEFWSSGQQVMTNAIHGNETSNYELYFRTKTNKTRYLLMNTRTRRDAGSNIIGAMGFAQDITEFKKHNRSAATI